MKKSSILLCSKELADLGLNHRLAKRLALAVIAVIEGHTNDAALAQQVGYGRGLLRWLQNKRDVWVEAGIEGVVRHQIGV